MDWPCTTAAGKSSSPATGPRIPADQKTGRLARRQLFSASILPGNLRNLPPSKMLERNFTPPGRAHPKRLLRLHRLLPFAFGPPPFRGGRSDDPLPETAVGLHPRTARRLVRRRGPRRPTPVDDQAQRRGASRTGSVSSACRGSTPNTSRPACASSSRRRLPPPRPRASRTTNPPTRRCPAACTSSRRSAAAFWRGSGCRAPRRCSRCRTRVATRRVLVSAPASADSGQGTMRKIIDSIQPL